MNDIQVLKSSFLHACELQAAERAAYLDSACHSNPALRGEIERMQSQWDDDSPLLEPATCIEAVSAAETVRQHTPSQERSQFSAGTVIGDRFELVEPIGEGGMGGVWKARQREPVSRLVAIKFVKVPPQFSRRRTTGSRSI